MRIRTIGGFLAAAAMIVAPVAASAATPSNPEASLSVANGVRAGTPTERNSKLFGGGILAAVIAAGIVAIIVIAAVNNGNDNKRPKSP